MQKRQITLQDGRYLIFYTFADEPAAPPSAAEQQGDAERGPEAKPEAEEERRV